MNIENNMTDNKDNLKFILDISKLVMKIQK